VKYNWARHRAKRICSTQSEATIIDLAWKSSAAVYEQNTSLVDPDLIFQQQLSLCPSSGGTVKATTITIISQSSSSKKLDNLYLPVMIVAVKGTKSNVDIMVNANCKGSDALGLFVCLDSPLGLCFAY
jgi:hypothetical protein